MKEILSYLYQPHQSLSREQAKEVMLKMATGQYREAQIASFLTVYNMRPITVNEFAGFRDAFIDLCIQVNLDQYQAIDLCGTGGDGKNTFNISTLASFVVAGAGYKVVKHGNSSVSSACGSSNVLEFLGCVFTNDSALLEKAIDQSNIAYFHAPLFHPALKYITPVRKSLGVKTFFNILGPTINPTNPHYQLVGVFSPQVAELYHGLFEQLGKKAFVIHGVDGYDEISLTNSFHLYTPTETKIMHPNDLGFKTITHQEIDGGNTVEEAAKLFMAILEGNGTPAQYQVVIANAAMAIQCVSGNPSIEECLSQAKESLESKNALRAFNQYKQIMSN